LFTQYEEERFKNLFPLDPSQVPTLERDFLAFGVEHRVEFGPSFFVNGTLRHDDNDAFASATTYSVDAVYSLGGGNTRIHGSVGRAVTNPTFFEQFGFVPGTFIGNPRLQPEEAFGWDLGVEHQVAGALLLDLTYFNVELEDEIQNLFPSVINTNGNSERRGVEVSASYSPQRHLSISADYTYTDADEPAGEEVRRPQHAASLSVAYEIMGGRGRLAANAVFNGEMLDDDFRRFFSNGFAPERTELDSYLLFNVNARYRVNQRLEVFVRVENLFDESYEEVISYAAPGRAIFGGARYRFGL
jgi:vitamin B12 transporter